MEFSTNYHQKKHHSSGAFHYFTRQAASSPQGKMGQSRGLASGPDCWLVQ
jgi:hypothetical protein